MDEVAVCGHEVCADEVVTCETELAHRPADAAAEGKARYSRRRHEAACRRETVRLSFVVDVGPGRSGADGGAAGARIQANLVQPREIDHDPAVAGREARNAVTAAADGDGQVVAAREADGRDHVGRTGAADDKRGSAMVVVAVPDAAGLGVALVVGRDDLAAHGLSQLPDRRFPENRGDGLTHVPLPSFHLGQRNVIPGGAFTAA